MLRNFKLLKFMPSYRMYETLCAGDCIYKRGGQRQYKGRKEKKSLLIEKEEKKTLGLEACARGATIVVHIVIVQ